MLGWVLRWNVSRTSNVKKAFTHHNEIVQCQHATPVCAPVIRTHENNPAPLLLGVEVNGVD